MTRTEQVRARLERDGVRWSARGHEGHTLAEGAPTPTEHLLVALATSYAATVARAAQRRGVVLADARFEASLDHDEKGEVEGVRMRVELATRASEQDVRLVLEQADRQCPVTDLLGFEVDRTLVLTPPG